MNIAESIAAAERTTKTVTTYRLPAETPIVDAQDAGDRVHPTRVEVTQYHYEDGSYEVSEYRVEVSGYKVKRDGTHKGASWHGVSYAVQRQFEEALGFSRVPKEQS